MFQTTDRKMWNIIGGGGGGGGGASVDMSPHFNSVLPQIHSISPLISQCCVHKCYPWLDKGISGPINPVKIAL